MKIMKKIAYAFGNLLVCFGIWLLGLAFKFKKPNIRFIKIAIFIGEVGGGIIHRNKENNLEETKYEY